MWKMKKKIRKLAAIMILRGVKQEDRAKERGKVKKNDVNCYHLFSIFDAENKMLVSLNLQRSMKTNKKKTKQQQQIIRELKKNTKFHSHRDDDQSTAQTKEMQSP